MQKYLPTVARVFLAAVFLGIVLLKLMNIASSPDGYMQYQVTLGQFGLPAIFAPLLILIQLVGGTMLLLGYKTRFAALVLSGLAFFMALVLGRVIPDLLFLYLGITGGMLLLSSYPQTPCSLDNK